MDIQQTDNIQRSPDYVLNFIKTHYQNRFTEKESKRERERS